MICLSPGVWDETQAFIHTNDHGLSQNLDALKEISKPTVPLSVSLIVGSGGLPSTLPDYETEAILVVDNNRFQLACLKQRLLLLKQVQNAEEYYKTFYSKENPLFTKVSLDEILWGLKEEIKILGKKHIFGSRFLECQKVASTKPVFLTICDLSKKGETLKLAHILNEVGGVITVANFTNLGDYYEGSGRLEESLLNLPIDKNAAILYSYLNGGGVKSKPLAIGLAQYFGAGDRV